jgi:biopolymer transport protein ExbD
VSLHARTAGLRSRRRADRSAMIELTPLIDIVFQLLIFFLLTATFQNNPSFRVKLPKAKNQEITQEPKAVVVTISNAGVMEVEGKRVDLRELQLRLCSTAEADPTTVLNIRADASTEHQHLVNVMDTAKACKLEKMGILTGK